MTVIDFPERRNSHLKPLVSLTKEARVCIAHELQLDAYAKAVVCGKCGTKLEPFEALQHVARYWNHYSINIKECRRDIEKLEQERDDLKKEVALLKAQKRRAQQ